MYILVNYTTNCTDANCDPDAIGLYVLHSQSSDSSVNRSDFSAYELVMTTIPINVPVQIPVNDNFYVIGIRDSGTCVTLHRVQVYYSLCKVSFASSVSEIVFGGNNTVQCVENTMTPSVPATCSAEGVLSPLSPCQCAMGFSGADAFTCTGECHCVLESE